MTRAILYYGDADVAPIGDYTTEPDNIARGFSGYVDAMANHCPFLRPSLQRSLTRWLRYETSAEAHQLPDLQCEIFAAAVERMELLRDQRRSRPSADGVLLCDNLAGSNGLLTG